MRVYIVGDTGVLDGLALWSMPTPNVDVMLYVNQGTLRPDVKAEIQRLRPSEIIIVGGESRVSSYVQDQLVELAPVVKRTAGGNRFTTAIEISKSVHPYGSGSPNYKEYGKYVPIVATITITDNFNDFDPFDETGRQVSIAATVTVTDVYNGITPTVLWNGDTETGNLSQWNNSPSVSGSGSAAASTERPHTGTYGLKLIANGLAGIRMKVQTLGADPNNLPTDAWYSAWYYIPYTEMRDNIFQYKYADADQWDGEGNPTHQTRRMICKASLNWNYVSESYDFTYNTRLRQATGGWSSGETDILATYEAGLPINQWFHIEMRYLWGRDGTGRSTFWVDGVQGWDLQNISTEPNNCEPIQEPRQWAVNHYLSDYENDNNRTTHIYIDDALIADGQVGP